MHPIMTAELVRQRRAELQADAVRRQDVIPIRRVPRTRKRAGRLRLLLSSR